MSDRVVPKSFRRHARLFGQVLIRCRYLIVDSIEQRRDRSAKMRDNDLDVGVAMRNLADDHVQHHQRVFQGRAHRSRQIEIVEQRRAQTVDHRMEAQNRAAPVHFIVNRVELLFGHRPVQDRATGVDPGETELVQSAFHLAQRRIHMRHR